jgi:phosphatidylglycerophosphate synthase
MEASDGKLARRTNNYNHLGNILDHNLEKF